MTETYTCEMCGGTFNKQQSAEWSDEKALAEMRRHFGEVKPEDQVAVCDECYKLIDPATHPHETEEAIADWIRRGRP